MKKIIALCLAVIFVLALCGCKELKRKNPADPVADNYIGITYKGEAGYSAGASVKALIASLGQICFAANVALYGDCVMRGETGAPEGVFDNISDICSDDMGTIYAVDHQAFVKVFPNGGISSQFALNITSGIDRLYAEWFNNRVYVSGTYDRTVISYTPGGIQADMISLTVTASGYFTPGRIFSSANYIFVADYSDPRRIVRLNGALTSATEFIFKDYVIDGCSYKGNLQILSEQAVYETDEDLKVIKTWGNFGEGPGRVLSGKLIAYNPADGLIYLLDGGSLKKFGE